MSDDVVVTEEVTAEDMTTPSITKEDVVSVPEEAGTIEAPPEAGHGQEEPTPEEPSPEDTTSEEPVQEAPSKEIPVIKEEVGSVEKVTSVDTLKKAGYYVIFGPQNHEASEVAFHIKSVHIGRFETKADLKKVINGLEEKGFKLIDIIKGRPLSFEVKTKTVNEITIGG